MSQIVAYWEFMELFGCPLLISSRTYPSDSENIEKWFGLIYEARRGCLQTA